MSVDIRSIEDLVRIIREHPEWRRELLVALLGDEFLQMPERLARVEEVLARLVESHERLAESHERLAESHARLTERVDRLTESHEQLRQSHEQLRESHERLAESHARLTERVDRLTESHEQLRESHERLAESHARLAERVDRLTESHEQLRESHERLTESHIRLAESHERLIEEVRELRAIVEQLLFRMARAESDIGHLRGEVLEIRYQQRAPAIFGYYVRRPRVLNVGHFLDELREQGQEFTHEEWLQLAAIDLLLSARHPQTREPLYLVVEVSRMIYPDDVERALERAEMLRQRGLSAYPAVAGEGIEPEAREMAERSRIFVLLNGVAIANGIRL